MNSLLYRLTHSVNEQHKTRNINFCYLTSFNYVFINKGRPRTCKPSLAQGYIVIFVETRIINNATANLSPSEGKINMLLG